MKAVLAVALAALTVAFATITVAGCANTPIVTTGCIQIVPEPGHDTEVHLRKGGIQVPGDNLLTATLDDPVAHDDAWWARRHAVVALPVGLAGVALGVVGLALVSDGAPNHGTKELAVGAPMLGLGVGGIIAGIVELKMSSKRGVRAIEGYNARHPACR
jgi:hypothetical protein